jgi:putative DNA methylase
MRSLDLKPKVYCETDIPSDLTVKPEDQTAALVPNSLRDAPALIESVFPAQKISFEAQKERKANLGQTLTGLGSYWKGRKPLILVRAIVLGSLLPQTGDTEKDLEIFEKLMAFDDEGLARRALIQNLLKPKEIAARTTLTNPWDFFSHSIKHGGPLAEAVKQWTFPLDCNEKKISLRWRRDIDEQDKIEIYRKVLNTFPSYEARAELCKRPEELDQAWLYEPIWPDVNRHYAHLGIEAYSYQELIEQLGVLRYGHRPKVGDTFCGGGSIPFEAARLGCDVYASDLNPIACMLTWGALNIIGASPERRAEIEQAQREVAEAVDREITALGIEHDQHGNRAKAYLYCLETRCPETGWMVPMSPSWVISKTRNVVARLIPDPINKRFDIDVLTGVSTDEMKAAAKGTIQDGALVYVLDGKTYRTPIKTLRGDFRDVQGNSQNRLRRWEKTDFKPATDDIYQERPYAVQWITKETLHTGRKETFFASVTDEDLQRERRVQAIVEQNLAKWQAEGLVPDMAIEPGYNTDQPIHERGWTYWHHLFNSRHLLQYSLYFRFSTPEDYVFNAKSLDWNSRIANWMNHWEKTNNVFYNMALNTFYNYGTRCFVSHEAGRSYGFANSPITSIEGIVQNHDARIIANKCNIFITDPPYADAIHYHEITEFFIAWLRKNPPAPFDQWTWDSRRALAIKGSGDEFRRGMVDAYRAMTEHMPDNGMQCVMFTHQDTSVWSDMIGIFWAAGLQVVGAWYIATETTSELKKGGYVQGTVILMLRKRPVGEKSGFKQRILPAVRNEVKTQIEQMMHLNDGVKAKLGEPVFNDSDLQMAGYAAALKVLTAYTHIGGEDVTRFALRPRKKGELTVVDEIVQQAAEAANSLLVPEGLSADTWRVIFGIQRFYLRMMDMETSGASKLDNYQNFAKAFRVEDYAKVMGSLTANKARLKGIKEFTSRDLSDSSEYGATWLGKLTIGLQQLLADTEPRAVVSQLQAELPEFMEIRPRLIDLLHFIELRSPDAAVRNAAEVLGNRLSNLRALGQ